MWSVLPLNSPPRGDPYYSWKLKNVYCVRRRILWQGFLKTTLFLGPNWNFSCLLFKCKEDELIEQWVVSPAPGTVIYVLRTWSVHSRQALGLPGKSRLFHYKQKHCQLSSQTQNQSCTAPIFADSAQTEYCTTFHCSSVRPSVCPSQAWHLTFLTYIKA